ncbi:ATP-binding protein [Streptomyces zagrosensis]|uniref:Anti-sigma regulatory factor (Ser/Thr protein kinase) n=1 Tax=Streptomyces zagrosensis TaxID=1042984 RepID=A0A7W9UW50_9ACTN|nr:ATP-binding protein [Streptomyces zagrosensis]MBB5933525.1 anti-sigma regulatory factor (Ser/Thr protein kinase) [Streptomyces zagrosensis]
MAPEWGVRDDELGPRWVGAIVLRPEPESVARARRWFRKIVAYEHLVCAVDDCELMLSELVTNAIRCGDAEGVWRVRVDWYRVGTTLRVKVRNPGRVATLRPRRAKPDEIGGAA